jgi:hypothetical protein
MRLMDIMYTSTLLALIIGLAIYFTNYKKR